MFRLIVAHEENDMQKPKEDVLLDVGESIDRLISVDVVPPYMFRDSIISVYEAAKNLVGKPLSLAAAEELKNVCKQDSLVIVSSGFVVQPYLPYGETDGPIGAVTLARSINKAFGSKILMLTEKVCVDSLRATCLGAGILPVDPSVAVSIPSAITVKEFPIDREEARREAEKIFKELNPVAMITVEKAGRNSKGFYHTALGADMSASVAKVDILFDMLTEDGRPTIGIGDYGNEIGLGSVIEAVRRIAYAADKCNCPCQGGIATTVRAKIPLVAAISNWGASGIAACLAALLNDFSIFHDEQIERRMIEQCCLAGSCDGATARPSFSVDGISIEGHVAMNKLLHEVIRNKTQMFPLVRE